jgi:hypothetical protein
VRRAFRISQRRQEKIEKLMGILKNQTEVSAEEKEAALWYWGCLFALCRVRYGTMPRPIPLLEGIQALYESKLLFAYYDPKMDPLIINLQSEIERLPTHSETTPQTEQSSLNVSA